MRSAITLFAAILLATTLAHSDEPRSKPTTTTAPAIKLNDFEKQFEKTMTGVTLVGRFSVDGKEDQLPKEEKYVITKVTKIGEDLWLFAAKIGQGNMVLPLPVPVKWAGDTPVISVTKFKVPTMGTYTARVMIYADHYAGTWDAGDHGGHLWGRLQRDPTK